MSVRNWVLTRFTRYRRPKIVEYHDPALASIFWLMVSLVVGLYIVFYQVAYMHAYAKYETPIASIDLWPEEVHRNASLPPYCDPDNAMYLFGLNLTIEEKEALTFLLNEGATCVNYTTNRHFRAYMNSFTITTFEMVGGVDHPVLGPNGRPRYFVKDVEGASVGMSVNLVTSWMENGIEVQDIVFETEGGNEVEPLAVYNDYYVIAVSDLLRMARVDLDSFTDVSQYVQHASPTRRMTGCTISLVLRCTNFRPFDFADYDHVRCIATAHTSDSSWGNAGSPIVFQPPDQTDTFQADSGYSVHLGLVFHMQVTGQLGRFHSQTLLRMIVDSLVLLTTSSALLNFICENFLPGRLAFVTAFREQVRLKIFRDEPLVVKSGLLLQKQGSNRLLTRTLSRNSVRPHRPAALISV